MQVNFRSLLVVSCLSKHFIFDTAARSGKVNSRSHFFGVVFAVMFLWLKIELKRNEWLHTGQY
jgi:hypothetical protein